MKCVSTSRPSGPPCGARGPHVAKRRSFSDTPIASWSTFGVPYYLGPIQGAGVYIRPKRFLQSNAKLNKPASTGALRNNWSKNGQSIAG